MASSGTKKGKTKWKPVDAAQIINPNAPRKLATSSWADESNEVEDYDFGGRKTDVRVNLPTAPRAARGPENDANIPKEPPFQAYLSNLSYDVTEEDLAAFFAELKVKSVRLPRDDRGNTMRAKGFGYVEFEDRNSLIEALSMPDTTCKNRRMRIEVAENGDQGRGNRGGPRDRGPNEPDRTLGDWRSGPRSEAEPPPDRDGFRSGPRRDYGSSGGGMYDRDRRGGSFRDDDRGGFRSREGDRPGFRDTRGFRDDRGGGGFRDDRGGGGFRDDRGGGGFRDDRGGGGFRDDRGGGFRDSYRDDKGFRDGGFRDSGFERRVFDDKRDDRRDERRGGGDLGDKGGWRRDPEPRDGGGPPPERSSEPKTRQRLNLQPRSKPVEDVVVSETSTAPVPTPSGSTAASIFGGAKPVDTAAREREIEERLAKQKDERPAPSSANTSAPPAREESRDSVSQPPSAVEDHPASSPPLEPAPPPKENVWARRSQQPGPEVNNGRISPHEDGETHKPQDSSLNSESRKYQPPMRNTQEDRKKDERGGPPRGGGTTGRGGTMRNADSKQNVAPKPREQKKETSDETIKMPKVQEQAPNFIGSNKYAYLEESENAAD